MLRAVGAHFGRWKQACVFKAVRVDGVWLCTCARVCTCLPVGWCLRSRALDFLFDVCAF